MKIRILILAITAFLIYSCNWFKKPEYYKYLYIPDKLHFPMETGDTAIFSCKRDDTVIYDTFYIEKYLDLADIFESTDDPYGPHKTGEYEIEEVYYENSKFNCILSINAFIKEPTFRVDWSDYSCDAHIKTYISHLIINNVDFYNIIKYSSLCCCDSIHQLYDIYFNRQNGLLKYTTTDSLTFELFAYKKLQCGISKNGEL